MSRFTKLVSNLPFQPSLLGDVAFYTRRLNQEENIRRLGFYLMLALMLVQLFSIIYPSKPSLATSSNDIIYGASSKDQVIKAYSQNKDDLGRSDIKAIYNHYGIGLDQLLPATSVRIGSRQQDFISTGRATSPGVDVFIPIAGAHDGGIYQRKLTSWDTGGQQNWYDTITGTSKFGFKFWIILDGCGNIVFEQNTLTPNLQISKKLESKSIAQAGDNVIYTIQFRNTGPGVAKNVVISDSLSSQFSYLGYTSDTNLKFSKSGSNLTWKINNDNSELVPSTRWHTIQLKLRLNNVSSSVLVCNRASLDASNSNKIITNDPQDKRCITGKPATCPGSGLPIPASGIDGCTVTCPDGSKIAYNQTCSSPLLFCQSLKIIESPSWSQRKFETIVRAQRGAVAKSASYYVNNKLVATQSFASNTTTQNFTYDFKQAGDYTIKATISATTGTVQTSQTCEINETITKPNQPQPQLSTDKTVSNLTQGIKDANNTLAKPGDKLKYTVFVYNRGDAPAVNLELNGEYGESINDILEYSDLLDKGDATFNSQTNYLSWGKVTVPAGGNIQKSFIVQVKDPLPSTPVSASDPLSFDFVMQNKYGRLVTIKLDKPASKVIEQTATVLPNTGPGSSMIITSVIFAVIAYFYYRSRLLKQELIIVRKEFSSGGGL